ncbi:MAG: hypothetical protein M3Y27_09595 [Acidobacteriota bacterium]|nr:hypothetical protein [Acidobacteriota bacterium]
MHTNSESPGITACSIWLAAPKERTAAYFPTYSVIARSMQAALRQWVRDWFISHPEVLARPHTAQPILVYICTHPFRGKRTNTFTYDIQQEGMLDMAFASAASRLSAELKGLKTERLAWDIRQVYFPYRSDNMVQYVRQNSRAFVKMLNAETAVVDALLKFAISDVRNLGLDAGLKKLRKAFATQLKRFSSEFDLSSRTEELLQFATEELWRTTRSLKTQSATEDFETIS